MRFIFTALSLALLPACCSAAAAPSSSAAPSSPSSFSLRLTAPEPRIAGGRLKSDVIAKRFSLDAGAVERSRKIGRLSTRLTPQLNKIFAGIERHTPKNAAFKNERGHWVARQRTGWTVDREQTKAKLLAAILQGQHEASVALKLTEPGRSVRDLARRGILYHVSSGESNFAGSPPFRVTNILAGARKLEERYVEAGKLFDFNAFVGKINKKNGFVPGYVIAGDTLSKEDGGGICQVSATIFRAAYAGGFPIVERHEHSHRVHYYDPVGYEATVYAPYKNFKFKNDTGAPLFVQATLDKERQTLRFDLFGARPKQTVQISGPQVSALRPPAHSTFVADKNVKPGRQRRIDVPMQGMTSVLVRRVKSADGKVRQDKLKSVYAPWGAVFAVNPADPRAGK